MRDLCIPLTFALIVLQAIWLGILGPMPSGVAAWLKEWQTLVAAMVALVAACVAFRNTTRTIDHASELEAHRRARKEAALRAVLPLALAQVSHYAERSAHQLIELVRKCTDERLPPMIAPEDLAQPLPSETLKTLAEFIEYSDTVDVRLIEVVFARIQIHDSRLRGLTKDNRGSLALDVVPQTRIENLIVDVASIYAGVGVVFRYARGDEAKCPDNLSWDEIRNALANMRLWDYEHPRLYDIIHRYEARSTGPFERQLKRLG